MFPATKLTSIAAAVWESTASDFYRHHWQAHGVKEKPRFIEYKDWTRIPPIKRDDLAAVPNPFDRLYDPTSADILRTTSGTTSAPLYLLSPQRSPYRYEEIRQSGGTRILSFNAYQLASMSALPAREAGIELIGADPHNLPRAQTITELVHIDALIISPTVAFVFADYLRRTRAHEKIKVVSLWGELCTEASFNRLKELYPRAVFYLSYQSSESHHRIGVSRPNCTRPYDTFHLQHESFYTEIVAGELLITSLKHATPFPLIRYRTGDHATLVEEPCACGDISQRIQLHGRVQGDFIRAAGGEFRSSELERVLTPFFDRIEPIFQLKIIGDTHAVPKLNLSVISRNDAPIADELLSIEIATALDAMRLSPTLTVRDAVEKQLCVRPTITFTDRSTLKGKTLKIKHVLDEKDPT